MKNINNVSLVIFSLQRKTSFHNKINAYSNLHEKTQRVRQVTCSRIIDRPELLLELEVRQKDPYPDPCFEPELLLLRMENGASHAGDKQNRIDVRHVRVRAPVTKARAGKQAS